MEIPYNLYLSYKDFKANYSNELNKYLELLENGNKAEFDKLLIEKYGNQIEVLEMLRTALFPALAEISIVLSYSGNAPKIRPNQALLLFKKCYGEKERPLFNEINYTNLKNETNKILEHLKRLDKGESKHPGSTDLVPKLMQLVEMYIWENKIPDFQNINERFLVYWKNNKETKKDLIYFLHFLMNEEYFRNVVNGKKLKVRDGKNFLSEYYYGEKLALSGAKKKYYSSISLRNNHLYSILSK